MGIIGWLIFSLGVFGTVYSSKCIPETAVCSTYWAQMEPHRNLMESKQELDSWCRKQTLFFRCLDDVLLNIYGNYSEFPTSVLVSKMFTEDLCLEGSKSRQRYLDNAACINQLDYEHCTLPEYLEIVAPGSSVPPTKCSLAEKTFSCIAATMVMRCGFDAGRVYRYLLKVTKYGEEICGVESSQEPTCEEEVPDSELSEIYYGLVNRFGRIPEKATEAISLDESTSLAEAIENALDDIYTSEGDISPGNSSFGYNEGIRSTDEFRKRPIITEPFKGLLFYNYSNEEFEFYWRQPGSLPIRNVTCEHKVGSELMTVTLICTIYYRHGEPECVMGAEEEITPELIRDIDLTIPEDSKTSISESPDWAGDLRDYKRHRMSWVLTINEMFLNQDKDIQEVNKQFVDEWPAPSEVCVKELRYFDILNDKYIDWWQCPSIFSDELRNEILTFLSPNLTRDTDFIYVTAINGIYSGGKNVSTFSFHEPLFHGFENILCERVNECHPRGKGVLKCSLERRGIEGCDSCCDKFPYRIGVCPTQHRTEQKEGTVRVESLEVFDSSEKGSGTLLDEHARETTFLVNDEATKTDESTHFLNRVTDESENLIAVDISEHTDESNNYFSSDSSLVFVRRISDDSNEDSFVAQPEDTLSISEVVFENLPDESELGVLNSNMFVLQGVQSISDIKAVYGIESNDHRR